MKQDQAICAEQMLALLEIFEGDWEKVMKSVGQACCQALHEALFPALFLALARCGALGEVRRFF